MDQKRILSDFGDRPLRFEPNVGQTDGQVKFLARGSGYTVFLTASQAVISFKSDVGRTTGDWKPGDLPRLISGSESTVLRVSLVGGNRRAQIIGEEELIGKSNYFIGSEPREWRTNVPAYARVVYRSVYPGVDLVYHGRSGRLEYDFVVAPGADPASIRLAIDGPKGLRLDREGDLLLRTLRGEIRQHKPLIYQEKNGSRFDVSCRYRIGQGAKVGFEVGAYDRDLPLTIDPVLVYSGSVAGSGADSAFGIAVDAFGNAFIAGSTTSLDFPTQNAYQPRNAGGADAFVTKLNISGSSVAYSTYFGGSNTEIAYGIAVAAGVAWITGYTLSDDFPISGSSGAIQNKRAGGRDAFLVGLNSGGGDRLLQSTFLGGPEDDFGTAVSIDTTGSSIYVTGAASRGFPTTKGAYQVSSPGGSGAFVAKFYAGSSVLQYSTYLAGSAGKERGSSIAVDANGCVYVVGVTTSGDFPTVSAAQPGPGSTNCRPGADGSPCFDAFATKLNPNGTALLWSTYLGGSADDVASRIALDPQGNVFVSGFTQSTDFPVVNALQSRNAGGWDGFVAKLSASGAQLLYSTYLGGSGDDFIAGLLLRSSGSIVLVGDTRSVDIPMTKPLQGQSNGGSDVFLAELSAAGDSLLNSTYLGGSGDDYGGAVAADSMDNIYLAGRTSSVDFPQTGSARPFPADGAPHAYVLRITPDDASRPSLPMRTVVTSDGWPIRYTAFNDVATVVFSGGDNFLRSDGIVIAAPDKFQKFARLLDPVPGMAGMVFYGFGNVAVNNHDDVGFVGYFSSDGTPFGNSRSGLFLFSGGSVARIAVDGDPAPAGLGNFVNFSSTRFWLNDSGMMLFDTYFYPTTPQASITHGLFLYRDGRITPVDSTGLSGETAPLFLDSTGKVSFYFRSADNGISRNSNGSVVSLVSVQDALPWGGSFSNIFDITPNGRGDVVFRGRIGAGRTNQGLFVRWSDGRLERIIAEGDPTPLGGTYHLWSVQTIKGAEFTVDIGVSPILNNVGTIVFTAPVVGGRTASGTFALEQGKLVTVVPPGTPAPDGSGNTLYLTASEFQLNDQDLILFHARTSQAIAPDSIFVRQANRIVRVTGPNSVVPGSSSEYLSPQILGGTMNESGEVLVESGICCGKAVAGLFVAEPTHPSVPNGDFEASSTSGLPLGWGTSWVSSGQGTASLSAGGAGDAFSGANYLRLHVGPAGGAVYALSDAIPVRSGGWYLISAQMRFSFDNASDSAGLAVFQYDAAGNELGYDEVNGVRGRSLGAWVPTGVLFRVQPGADSIRIRIGLRTTAESNLDVDAIR